MYGWIWAACLLSCVAVIKTQDDPPAWEVQNAQIESDLALFDGAAINDNDNGSQTIAQEEGAKIYQVTYGHDVKSGQFPYMAVIMIYYFGRYYHICGGVILNQHTVLTSAYCLRRFKYYRYYVGVGIVDLRQGLSNPGSQRIKITDYVIHPHYEPNGYGFPNDIAAVYLYCRIKYNAYVQPAPLATKYDGNFAHAGCLILGFGRTEWGYPNILQTGYMHGLNNYMCQQWWAIYFRAKIHGTHFCVYRYPVSGCFGDSGGPVVCRGKVVGLLSWAGRKCTGCRPTVSTRISSYWKWIRSVSVLH